MLDYTVYFANMSTPSFQTVGPIWRKLYSFKEAYGSLLSPPYTNPLAVLTPAFFHNVTTLFETNDTAFQEYIFRKQRGFDFVPCTGSCKTDGLCQLRSAQSQFACYGLSPLSINKRSIQEDIHSIGDCPVSRAVPYLRAFSKDRVALNAAVKKYLK